MWVKTSMWDRTIELGVFDRWVITGRSRWALSHWLESGFARVSEEGIWQAVRAALAEVDDREVPVLWQRLFEYAPAPDSVDALARELVRAAREPLPRVIVLERLVERGFRFEPLPWKPRPLPPRTDTEHYVVIEAVTDAVPAKPVAGLQLELVIADGEVKWARTGADGVARVERIRAGRAVIRVLGLDGEMWRPLDGDACVPSANGERIRTHVVKRGECLSRIAHQHGIRRWQRIWDHPKNERLRKRRKSPHVLHPGDEVAVPGVDVHEIIRSTDATHRIAVDRDSRVPLLVHVRSHAETTCADVAWSLFDSNDREVALAEGRTDAQGRLRALVPVRCETLLLLVHEPEMAWELQVGALVAEREQPDGGELLVSGIQGRLQGLGFDCGPIDGIKGPRTIRALAAFQELTMGQAAATGELDIQTADRLVAEYEV
jgi:N-acetylmuramoyl-L-alanine amidase